MPVKPKYGVLTFSYSNFTHFRDELLQNGHYSVNLGDNAQTLAARALLLQIGIAETDIIDVDRDTLSQYSGPPVRLLMNAVFRADCFPLPKAITPVFLGFNAKPDTLPLIAEHLRNHAPIGCRDTVTAQILTDLGIEAFVSGCVTMTLTARQKAPKAGNVYIVYGSGSGKLPKPLLRHIPPEILENAEPVYHRLPMFEHPLSQSLQMATETFEAGIMAQLKARARLVITPLHHVAAPCMAMGIPTLICRSNNDPRFSFLKQIIPVYTPETFDKINWYPGVVDMQPVTDNYVKRLKGITGLV